MTAPVIDAMTLIRAAGSASFRVIHRESQPRISGSVKNAL